MGHTYMMNENNEYVIFLDGVALNPQGICEELSKNKRLRRNLQEALVMAISRGEYVNSLTDSNCCEIDQYNQWLKELIAQKG